MKTKDIVTLMILAMLVATPSAFAGNSQEKDQEGIFSEHKSDFRTTIDAGREKVIYSAFDVEEESVKEDNIDQED